MNDRPAAPPPLLNVDITEMLHAVLNAAESPVSLACSPPCIGLHRCSLFSAAALVLQAPYSEYQLNDHCLAVRVLTALTSRWALRKLTSCL